MYLIVMIQVLKGTISPSQYLDENMTRAGCDAGLLIPDGASMSTISIS